MCCIFSSPKSKKAFLDSFNQTPCEFERWSGYIDGNKVDIAQRKADIAFTKTGSEVTIVFNPDDHLETKFTFESDRGGVVEDEPFRILILGDWNGDGERAPLEQRRPVEIDRDNFDQVMSRAAPRVRLSEDASVEIRSLEDLHPDRLFDTLPMFAELRDLRKRLSGRETFNEAARELRGFSPARDDPGSEPEVEQASQAAPESLLDAILSQPSGGAPKPASSLSPELKSLIGDIVRPHLVSVDENDQRAMVASLDAAASGVMRGVLQNRRFREMEAAWRALFLLVRRVETTAQLKIFILDINRDELATDMSSVSDLDRSFVHNALVKDDIRDRWALVCGNYAYAPIVTDVAALIRVSQICALANAPFISHMRPDVFGVDPLMAHSRLEVSSDTDECKLWTALRGTPDSEFLGMVSPRFLVRTPYGKDTEPTETFDFQEIEGAPSRESYVWANACFIAAILFAESFTERAWALPEAISTDIAGLSTHAYEQNGEIVFQGAAETQLTENTSTTLAESGMMPLASFKNSDRLRLVRFQSVSDTGRTLRGRWSI